MQLYDYMTINNIKTTSLEGYIANDWICVNEPHPTYRWFKCSGWVNIISKHSALFIWGCYRGLSNSHKTLH